MKNEWAVCETGTSILTEVMINFSDKFYPIKQFMNKINYHSFTEFTTDWFRDFDGELDNDLML